MAQDDLDFKSDKLSSEIDSLLQHVAEQAGDELPGSSYVHSYVSRRKLNTGLTVPAKIVQSTALHPLAKTMCSHKHGLLQRWTMGKAVFPSVRLVVVPHNNQDETDIVYLSRQALTACGYKPPDDTWFLVLINRPPSIKESNVQVVRAMMCDEPVCKVYHTKIGTMDGDYDGDTMTVWLLPPTYLHGSLGSMCHSSNASDELAASNICSEPGCFTTADVAAKLLATMPPSVGTVPPAVTLPGQSDMLDNFMAAGGCKQTHLDALIGGCHWELCRAGLGRTCEPTHAHVARAPLPPRLVLELRKARRAMCLQKAGVGLVGSDCRQMRSALSYLTVSKTSRVMWGSSTQLGNLTDGGLSPSKVQPGMAGLRIAMRVSASYTQSALDVHKLSVLNMQHLCSCLSKSLVAPVTSASEQRAASQADDIIMMVHERLGRLIS